MTFWAYMLHCGGGYFYVGHTDNLELQTAQHQRGDIPGFATDHRPVELVWSQEFATRDEARAAERQIKGWSRAKKMALIRGDWSDISRLSKGKGSPSTSSGKSGLEEGVATTTDHPELVEGLSLLCHPNTPSVGVRQVVVIVEHRAGGDLDIIYYVEGTDQLVLPPSNRRAPFDWPLRKDGLWKTTCFELFIKRVGSPGYIEFNFSPSGSFAAYAFEDYRLGMRNAVLNLPWDMDAVRWDDKFQMMLSGVAIPEYLPGDRLALALSAVIEETDGTKSYWALRHPPGPPDFHHPDCFALTLEAPRPA